MTRAYVKTELNLKSCLMAGAAGLALGLLAISNASAQEVPTDMAASCTPSNPSTGDTVTCTGGTNSGISYNVDDLTVIAGSKTTPINIVAVGNDGIFMTGFTGTLSVDIQNTASTVGSTQDGIKMQMGSSGSGLSLVSDGDISASRYAINLDNLGTGSINVTVSGDVTGGQRGVDIVQYGSSLTVDVAGTTSGDDEAVYVRNYGTSLTNLAFGDVTSSAGAAFDIYTGSSATSLTITAGTVEAQTSGFDIVHSGIGALNVTTGNITTTSGQGMRLLTEATMTGDTSLRFGDINAGHDGVYGFVQGHGDFELSAGTITSSQAGLELWLLNSGDSTISVDNIYASHGAISLNVGSGGTVNVTSSGELRGRSGIFFGENVSDSANVSSLVFEAVDVTATSTSYRPIAIHVYLTDSLDNPYFISTRTIDITTTGTVTGRTAVYVDHVNNTADDRSNAISLDTPDADEIDVYVYGDVAGGRFGTVTNSDTATRITISDFGSVDGGTAAIRTQGANANDVINLEGEILGDVLMLQGDDTFVALEGSQVAATATVDLGTGDDELYLSEGIDTLGGLFRGGLGTDQMTLTATTGSWSGGSGFSSSDVRQFERISVESDASWTLGGTHFNYDQLDVRAGSELFLDDGARIFADIINIEETAFLDLGNGASLNRTTVNLDGTLSVGGVDMSGSASIQGALNMNATGVLDIDLAGDRDSDLLRVTGSAGAGWGDVSLAGVLQLEALYTVDPGDSYTIINAVNGLSGTFDAINGAEIGGGIFASVDYDYTRNKVTISTEAVEMTPEAIGSKSASSAANYILGQVGGDNIYAELGWDVGTMATAKDIGNFATGMTPDILDNAVSVADGAALRFGQTLAGCDVSFSLNSADACARRPGQTGPALFGGIQMTSASGQSEIGHNFAAQSFDMNLGLAMSDAGAATQYGLMSGYAKSGSVSDAMAGEARDGLEAETFSLGAYARRDLGWWSLDGTAMVSTSEAKLVRNITPGLGIAEQAQSEFVSRQFNLQGTATLNGLGQTEFAIKPLATVGNRTLQRDGFTESGADLLGLTVNGQTRNVSYAGIGAELTPDFTDEQGNGFRGMLRVTGLAYTGDTEKNFSARFTNAPGDSSFIYFGQNLDTSVLLEGGFQYLAPNGFAIGAEGFGEVNPETGDSATVGATLQLVGRW